MCSGLVCVFYIDCFVCGIYFFFFFKQKTAYEMRISDWSSDVCSSDLIDYPAETAILSLLFANFLHHIAPVGPRLHQHFADRLFGGIVRGGHEIGWALARHLQRLDLVEVAAQPGRGLADRKSTRLNSSH